MARGIPEEQLTANGTLRPQWTNELTGDVALQDEGFEAVREGYACGNCLLWFKGLYHSRCPACGEPTGHYQIVPQWWTERSAV